MKSTLLLLFGSRFSLGRFSIDFLVSLGAGQTLDSMSSITTSYLKFMIAI